MHTRLLKSVLLLFLTLPFGVRAEDTQYLFSTINKSNGLSDDGVRCIMRDSRGYVWIGTYVGLNRYDGTRICSYYREDLGIDSNYISSLAEDRNGNIWIGTSGGAVVYDYRNDCFRIPEFSDGSSSGYFVSSITGNSKGEIWLDSGADYLISYDGKYLEKHPAGSHVEACRMAFDSKDRLFVCGNMVDLFSYSEEKGLVPLDLGENKDIFKNDEIYGPVINPKSNDILYVAAKKAGLCEVNMRDRTVKVLYAWQKDQKPIGLSIDRGRYLWAPTLKGLIRFDILTGESLSLSSGTNGRFSIPEDYLICAVPDNRGGIWVGSRKSGVGYAGQGPSMFRKVFSTSDGRILNGCMVRSFAQSSEGVVWVATERRGLLRYVPSTGELTAIDNPKIPAFLTDIITDGSFLWLGTQSGIIKYDTERDIVKEYLSSPENSAYRNNRISALFKTTSGRILAGTTSGELQYSPKSDDFIKIPASGFGSVESFAEEADGTLWMGTYSKGLYSISAASNTAVFHSNCSHKMISSLLMDNSGELWVVGYNAEISRYVRSSDSFESFSPSNLPALPRGSFLSAQQDSRGHLWVSSTSGLIDLDPSALTATTYRKGDGLLDDDFCKASMKSYSGDLYFGSSDGFIVFNPDDIREMDARVDITALYVGGVRVRPGEKGSPITANINLVDRIVLDHDNNAFLLEFATPEMTRTKGITCCLEGYDAETGNVSSDGTVSYYNLPAGTYILKISGHRDIRVIVRPSFFASFPGVLIIILAFLAIMVSAMLLVGRWQSANKRKREEEFKREKEAELIKEKMSFLSGVIHEIKTPLTLIKTPLQNLISAGVGGEASKDLGIIRNSTDYLDRLSKELLEFVNVEEVGYVLNTKPIDVVETISLLCFNFSDAVKDRNLRLEFRHSQDQIIVQADEKALRKILNNLIHNALKYSESYIEIEAEEVEGKAKICFRNDGEEIPASKRQEIFKPFVQIKKDGSIYPQSFGIGLSLAQRLAELHKGTLLLSPGKTTEFVLSLPLSESRLQDGTSQVMGKIKDNGLPVVLIVEDNEELAEFLVEKLNAENFNAVAVHSAEKALEMVYASRIDVVLTDITMPGMGGFELCRRLSSNPDTSHIPVVVISATASENAKIKCMKNGASFYIEKPFTVEYLVASINGILGKYAAFRPQENPEQGIDLSQFNIPDRDAEFLRNLDAVVDKHLSDDTFSVKQLEDELYMSHSSLIRKMSSLLGTTSVDYIKTKRLKAAAQILKSRDVNISEVGYRVGFNSPSYFSKCFKDMFGKTPVEYAKDNLEKQ